MPIRAITMPRLGWSRCADPRGHDRAVRAGTRSVQLRASELNDALVMENGLIFGSVNANRRHYAAARQALEQAPAGFLSRMLTRVVPIERYAEAFEKRPADIKTVLQLSPDLT